MAGLWQRTNAGPSERSYGSSLEALLSFFFSIRIWRLKFAKSKENDKNKPKGEKDTIFCVGNLLIQYNYMFVT